MNHRRCGNPGCRCAAGEGHPQWVLTYSVDGKKATVGIPHELATELEPLLAQGQKYQQALAEIRAANAQLLHLWLKEQRQRPPKPHRGSR